MKLRNSLMVLVCFFLVACNSGWVRMEQADTTVKTDRYSLTLPAGWVKWQQQEHMLATLDGLDIQRIDVQFVKHDKAFEKIKKSSSTDLLPSELADLFVANLKAEDENGLPSLEIINSHPVEIAGTTGFELELRFVSDEGLRYQVVVSGFATDNGFYTIYYRAPVLYFYDRDREIYSTVTHSFKLI